MRRALSAVPAAAVCALLQRGDVDARSEPRAAATTEPVEAQLGALRRDGFVVLRGVLRDTAAVASLRTEVLSGLAAARACTSFHLERVVNVVNSPRGRYELCLLPTECVGGAVREVVSQHRALFVALVSERGRLVEVARVLLRVEVRFRVRARVVSTSVPHVS